MYNTKINTAYSKKQTEVTEQLAIVADRLDRAVLEYGSISEAVRHLEVPQVLKVPMHQILDILTKPKGKQNLNKFLSTYPNPLLCTIATTLYIRTVSGNPILPTGETALSRDLSIIVDECNDNIQYNKRLKTSYSSLSIAPLVSLGVWPLCELFLLKEVPGTAKMINGTYGFAVHMAIIFLTLFVYSSIANKMRTDVCTLSDRKTLIDRLLEIPKLRNFVKSLTPKSGKSFERLQQKLKKALSTRDMNHVWMEKVLNFCLGFVFAIIFLVLNTVYIRTSMANNYSSLSIMPISVTDQQLKQMKTTDAYMLALSADEFAELEADDTKFKAAVNGRISGLSSTDCENQVTRIITKYHAYHDSSYKWYWWLIAFGVGVIATFVPDFELSSRRKSVENYIQQEITQLQTLGIVLGDSNISTYEFICWMEKQAVLYKSTFAGIHYNYNKPLESINKAKIGQPREFRRIIERLASTVNSLTLADAFRSMTVEKRQSLTERKIMREAKLASDAVTARLVSMAPALFALIACMVLPILIFGFGSLTSATSSLGSM